MQSCSPASLSSSDHSTAASMSSKPNVVRGRAGRKRGSRYQNASQSQLAESLQSTLTFNSFRIQLSPSDFAAKQRQERAIANRTAFTHVHIGAALLGKCVGFGPHPHAQTEALEKLLQSQNPANWNATVAKSQQLADAERVQQLAANRPELLCALQHQQQLAAFDTLPDAQQQQTAAVASIQACLTEALAKQKSAESLSASRATAVASTVNASAEMPASTSTAATEVATAATEVMPAATEVVPAATEVAPAAAEFEPAATEVATAATQAATAATLNDDVNCQAQELVAELQTMPSEDSNVDISDVSSSSAIDVQAYTEDSCAGMSDTASSSNDIPSESEADDVLVQSVPSLTKADVDMVVQYAKQISNCAYGIQAERDMIKEFELQAQQAQHAQQRNYDWYKMGAPDEMPLGNYAGIDFELGCQIDRALCHSQSSKAIPVEFKNRREHFPPTIPEHEYAQVQAQLQLCNAPMGLLVERLQLADGSVVCQEHQIFRQDRWWQRKILPSLHRFLTVFAMLATQQEQLDLYFSKRATGQHHRYLRSISSSGT